MHRLLGRHSEASQMPISMMAILGGRSRRRSTPSATAGGARDTLCNCTATMCAKGAPVAMKSSFALPSPQSFRLGVPGPYVSRSGGSCRGGGAMAQARARARAQPRRKAERETLETKINIVYYGIQSW